MVPDFARVGFTAAIPLPNQGFPARFLGFADDRDPTNAGNLSKSKRDSLFKELRAACSSYILGDLTTELTTLIEQIAEGCRVGPDEDDVDRQTLLIEYPTLYPSSGVTYVAPRVKIELGARSALDPTLDCTVTPYVAGELLDWRLTWTIFE